MARRTLQELVDTLREEYKSVVEENHVLLSRVADYERLVLEKKSADRAFDYLYVALGHLARGVPAKTSEGKVVRAETRRLMMEGGITPPPSLGRPRVVKKRKKKSKKKAKKKAKVKWQRV